MNDLDITMEEYIRLETENALRKGKVYNWETATYGKIRYDEDVHFLRSVEMKFPTIVYNDALTSKLELSCEPTVSPQHIDKVNWKIEISLSDSDDKNYTVIYDNDSFSYKIFNVDDLKLDMGNGDDKIDIKQSSGDLSIEPLPNVINTDVGAYAQGSNELLETIHDTSIVWKKTENSLPVLVSKANTAYRGGFLGLDTAYSRRVIRRIGNWSNALSCEVQALIRSGNELISRIECGQYGVLVEFLGVRTTRGYAIPSLLDMAY
ncbi:hypothetical protein Tco_0445619 [Tanacetum coccineum]